MIWALYSIVTGCRFFSPRICLFGRSCYLLFLWWGLGDAVSCAPRSMCAYLCPFLHFIVVAFIYSSSSCSDFNVCFFLSFVCSVYSALLSIPLIFPSVFWAIAVETCCCWCCCTAWCFHTVAQHVRRSVFTQRHTHTHNRRPHGFARTGKNVSGSHMIQAHTRTRQYKRHSAFGKSNKQQAFTVMLCLPLRMHNAGYAVFIPFFGLARDTEGERIALCIVRCLFV